MTEIKTEKKTTKKKRSYRSCQRELETLKQYFEIKIEVLRSLNPDKDGLIDTSIAAYEDVVRRIG